MDKGHGADMTRLQLDSDLTFDNFVLGPANRLAAAAARRAADSPGAGYNPLFLHGASGLGKTHLLTAVGLAVGSAQPSMTIVYDALERRMFPGGISADPDEQGDYLDLVQQGGLLLLDDVQLLSHQPQVQQGLLRVWDLLSRRGVQVVLAGDRPPAEIHHLDQRLLSRFSGGLVVDLSSPDQETRAAILRRMAEGQGVALGEGVVEVLAGVSFGNVRALRGGLNKLMAFQELESRAVEPHEVAGLLGIGLIRQGCAEFEELTEGVHRAIAHIIGVPPEYGELKLPAEAHGGKESMLQSPLDVFEDYPQAPPVGDEEVDCQPDRPKTADADLTGWPEDADSVEKSPHPPEGDGAGADGQVMDPWFLSREKVVWDWPYVEDLLVEDSD